MKAMNSELKKVVNRVKAAQAQLQTLLKDRTWVEDARKYAERQGKEVRKLFTADVNKVKTFLERERKELDKFQKQIPGEVKKFRKFVIGQRKELEKLLLKVRNAKQAEAGSSGKTAKRASGTRKRAAARKSTAAST
jgi:hypothetical protein